MLHLTAWKNLSSSLPLVHLSVVGAGLVLVMLANVEYVGVGLRDAAPHQVDVLHVALRLQLLVPPHKLQHRDPTRCRSRSLHHQNSTWQWVIATVCCVREKNLSLVDDFLLFFVPIPSWARIVKGAQESIPRSQFRQAVWPGGPVRQPYSLLGS